MIFEVAPLKTYSNRAPLFCDNSLLSSVDCSTDLALRYIHGYSSIDEKAPMLAGTATHHALDIWFSLKDKAKAMEAFEASYRDFADEHIEDPEDRLTWENTSSILENWLDTRGLELIKDVEVIPGFVEVAFAYPLGADVPIKKSKKDALYGAFKNGDSTPSKELLTYYDDTKAEFVMCGRFDLLVRWKGQVYVWENKTTGSVSRLKDTLRFGSQLAGYLWAAKKIVSQISPLKEVSVSGVIVNAIEYRKMAGSDRKCYNHGVKYSECKFLHLGHAFLGPLSRSPEMLIEWEKTALNLARRYRELLTNYSKLSDVPKLRTQGQFEYNRCPNCTFSEFCLAGRPMDRINSMLKVEPWSPFESVIQDSQALFMSGEVVRR